MNNESTLSVHDEATSTHTSNDKTKQESSKIFNEETKRNESEKDKLIDSIKADTKLAQLIMPTYGNKEKKVDPSFDSKCSFY